MSESTQFVLMDIEGTTSDIAFVQNVLFPYARKHLPEFLSRRMKHPAVYECLVQVQDTVKNERQLELTLPSTVDQLIHWIDEDRKHPALKTLQGWVWKEGFEKGDFTAHIYDDVKPSLDKWKSAGLRLGIFSSGSVEAQKVFFTHTEKGNLTPYFEAYFDLSVGSKKDADSYCSIAKRLNLPSESILFVSDVGSELDAASEARMQTGQVLRPGIQPCDNHSRYSSFAELPV